MSADFERLLRAARAALPGPDEAVTRRARERALAAIGGRRRLRRRSALALAAALVAAVGLGVGVGALVTPSGSAAPLPSGFGFLPARGWNVLLSGEDVPPVSPAVAIAANVPLSPEDDPDGLPYSTLRTLPPHGVVMVVSFTELDERVAHLFPRRELPLRLGEAAPHVVYGAVWRRPLGEYQLRAAVNGYAVDVNAYFGTRNPRPSAFVAAQRQLDRLVVRPAAPAPLVEERALAARSAESASGAASRVLDRTLLCTSGFSGGIREVEVRGHAGLRGGGAWSRLPFAVVSTGPFIGGPGGLGNSLAYVAAGRASAETTIETEWRQTDAQPAGSLALNRTDCKPAATRIPLSARGLRGGVADPLGEEFDCAAPRSVLVRVRATFRSAGALFREGELTKMRAPLSTGYLAVASAAGRPIAFAAVSDSGKARLFTAATCVEE